MFHLPGCCMQRYGPPPAYPNLRIPGLNAPIPEGSSFGYHPGGWGKPPVDETGRPLYGDVFAHAQEAESSADLDGISRDPWGKIEEQKYESRRKKKKMSKMRAKKICIWKKTIPLASVKRD